MQSGLAGNVAYNDIADALTGGVLDVEQARMSAAFHKADDNTL